MEYRQLGNSGILVSNLALGTMNFGTRETSEEEAFAQLDAFLEAGGNLIDTADVYNGGVAEETVGRWFAGRPREVTDRAVIATKGRTRTGDDVNDAGTSRRHLDRALTTSLRRLGTDAIDLYQLHAWDPLTPVEETLSFHSNRTAEQVNKDIDRDKILSATEALEYGLIDQVLAPRKSTPALVK